MVPFLIPAPCIPLLFVPGILLHNKHDPLHVSSFPAIALGKSKRENQRGLPRTPCCETCTLSYPVQHDQTDVT